MTATAAALDRVASPRLNRYMPHPPHPRQLVFLSPAVNAIGEVLFGGAAGGGKSAALLMAALQYVDCPGYAALVLRRTYSELTLPEALMTVAEEWLSETDARWNSSTKTWHFPGGGTLTFGYLENTNDKHRYQGASFHFIGFDELTQFRQEDYLYLHSRLRRTMQERHIPIRMRATSNPGGIGHDWVRERFILQRAPGRLFIPSKIADNPSLDEDNYRQSLMHLSPVERERLMNGDWDVLDSGHIFDRSWFVKTRVRPSAQRSVRYWDKAATAGGGDYTVGVLMDKTADDQYCVSDVVRGQWGPVDVERTIKETAHADGTGVEIVIEQEPGSAGVDVISHYVRRVLPGFRVKGNRVTGDKVSRAGAFASQARAGNVTIREAGWNEAYLRELEIFANGANDDQVDASTGAFNELVSAQQLRSYQVGNARSRR